MSPIDYAARFPGDTIMERVARFVFAHASPGNPDSVVEAIDRFNKEVKLTMNLGPIKSAIIDDVICRYRPTVAFELGAFCGYSAVRLGQAMRQLVPTAKYYSFEVDPLSCQVSRAMAEFAGLSDVIEVIEGAFEDALEPFLASHPSVTHVDLVFIDHAKDLYTADLRRIEERLLLNPGAVVTADNIIYPGAPEYFEYISKHPSYQTTLHKVTLATHNAEDAVSVSVRQ